MRIVSITSRSVSVSVATTSWAAPLVRDVLDPACSVLGLEEAVVAHPLRRQNFDM